MAGGSHSSCLPKAGARRASPPCDICIETVRKESTDSQNLAISSTPSRLSSKHLSSHSQVKSEAALPERQTACCGEREVFTRQPSRIECVPRRQTHAHASSRATRSTLSACIEKTRPLPYFASTSLFGESTLRNGVGLPHAGTAARDRGDPRSGCGSWTGDRTARRRSAIERARSCGAEMYARRSH